MLLENLFKLIYDYLKRNREPLRICICHIYIRNEQNVLKSKHYCVKITFKENKALYLYAIGIFV